MSACYEALLFVMDCNLARVASNPGQYRYRISCPVVLVISRLDLILVDHQAHGRKNAHALIVDTRPFPFWEGWGTLN